MRFRLWGQKGGVYEQLERSQGLESRCSKIGFLQHEQVPDVV